MKYTLCILTVRYQLLAGCHGSLLLSERLGSEYTTTRRYSYNSPQISTQLLNTYKLPQLVRT